MIIQLYTLRRRSAGSGAAGGRLRTGSPAPSQPWCEPFCELLMPTLPRAQREALGRALAGLYGAFCVRVLL